MSVKILYDVENGEALEKALKDLRKAMKGDEGNLVAKALMKAAYPVWRDAQTRAPISGKDAYTEVRRTKKGYKKVREMGTLRKGIKRIRHRNPRVLSEIVGVGVFIPKGTTRENDLGPWYAHFVEFGTKKWKGKPFLRPALEANSARAIAIYGSDLGKNIEKEGAKIGRRYENYGSRRTKV